MDSGEEESFTPPEVRAAAKEATNNLLPNTSRKKYEVTYKAFLDWRNEKGINNFSENVLLAYFGELQQKYQCSTMWSIYSMLRSTLIVKNDIHIEKYAKLRALLKRKSEGFQPKKSRIFTTEQINEFITEAPDKSYLVTKIVLIVGLMGACRTSELHAMNIEDVQDLKTAIFIKVPITKTKTVRSFTITGNFYEIMKQYIRLRPPHVKHNSFFLNYQQGRCTCQRIGINKLAAMGKQIAQFLQLPEANLYTGHSFRRSSATVLVDAGADITALKRHGGWKSNTVAEGYIDTSMKNKMDTANKIGGAVQECSSNAPSTSKIASEMGNTYTNTNQNLNVDVQSPPLSIVNNYGTINIFINNREQ